MKFVSINIEGDKHFERILPFLMAEQPDVLALQEIFEADLDIIKQTTGLTNCVFYPQANITKPNIHLPVRGNWGIAIFAKEIVSHEAFYYFGHKDGIVATFENEKPDLIDRVVIVAKAKVSDQIFQVATVHFTWSGKAETTEAQKTDYLVLQSFLDQFDEMIFCGDLNATRGAEIWSSLAKKYTDNIPVEVETTIDKNLHKSGKDIRLVVDALFTSSHYLVRNAQVVPNTSDHMAVVGEIERV
jgi:endonuclease/exonuclease/phosphatase family metal-dependent hydrolase